MARTLRTCATGGCLVVLVVLMASSKAVGSEGWPYWSGYCGSPSLYTQDYVPYFAQHPPVYYSYPVARPYGYSPYAYPPGYPTPEIYATEPRRVRNQYASTPSSARTAPEEEEEEIEEPQPLRIINPYVVKPEKATEASATPRPQIVYPAALARRQRGE